jgi:hypothetical protein
VDAAHRGNKQSDGEFSDEQGADDGGVGCGFCFVLFPGIARGILQEQRDAQ